MNNSYLPASPLNGDAYADFAAYDGTSMTSYNPDCQGLTKREHFAGLAMQGICASSPTISNEIIAIEAVILADALLKELEKDK